MIVEVTGLNEVRQTLAGGGRVCGEEAVKAFRRIGPMLSNYMMREQLSGQALKVRTGEGRRSVFYRVTADADDRTCELVVGVDLTRAPYMRLQEFGGTVRPVNGRYLTVPLKAAQTAKGVSRFTARDVISAPEAHGFTGTFFAKQLLFGRKANGSIVPLFALRESVTLRPAGYMRATIAATMPQVEHECSRAVEASVQRLAGQ